MSRGALPGCPDENYLNRKKAPAFLYPKGGAHREEAPVNKSKGHVWKNAAFQGYTHQHNFLIIRNTVQAEREKEFYSVKKQAFDTSGSVHEACSVCGPSGPGYTKVS